MKPKPIDNNHNQWYNNIFTLDQDNAPFVHSIVQKAPNFVFNYDIANKPAEKSTFVHLIRSAFTVSAYSLFILVGLVEKAIRFSLSMIKKGIDKVLTKDQQDNIKQKAGAAAQGAKEAGKSFFETHFMPLFQSEPKK